MTDQEREDHRKYVLEWTDSQPPESQSPLGPPDSPAKTDLDTQDQDDHLEPQHLALEESKASPEGSDTPLDLADVEVGLGPTWK